MAILHSSNFPSFLSEAEYDRSYAEGKAWAEEAVKHCMTCHKKGKCNWCGCDPTFFVRFDGGGDKNILLVGKILRGHENGDNRGVFVSYKLD